VGGKSIFSPEEIWVKLFMNSKDCKYITTIFVEFNDLVWNK